MGPCSVVGLTAQQLAENCSQRGLQFLCLFIKTVTTVTVTRFVLGEGEKKKKKKKRKEEVKDE